MDSKMAFMIAIVMLQMDVERTRTVWGVSTSFEIYIDVLKVGKRDIGEQYDAYEVICNAKRIDMAFYCFFGVKMRYGCNVCALKVLGCVAWFGIVLP